MSYVINKSCTSCGACLPECPTGSILEGKDQFHIDVDTCLDHAACVNVCPVDAIKAKVDPAASSKARLEEEEEE